MMGKLKNLDPVNIELKGTKLIEASAGTGKTYAITGLYVRLVVERELPVDKILVVTFTEAATMELRDRVRNRLLEALSAYELGKSEDAFLHELVAKHRAAGFDIERCCHLLSLAVHSIDLAAIYTIHGFCLRVLQDFSFESGALFDLQFAEDDSDILATVIDDYWRINSRSWHKVLLSYFYSRKINADQLFFELKEIVRNCFFAGIDILDMPAGIAPSDFQPAAAELKGLWLAEQEEIRRLLESPALSKNKKDGYSPDKVDGWLRAIDDFFMGGDSAVFPAAAFESLSSAALVKGTMASKAGQTPEHRFFNLAGELVVDLAKAYHGMLLELIKFCLREVPLRKRAIATFSFDDLLLQVRDSLRDAETGGRLAEKTRNQYLAVLIDEFQDTDIVQYEIFQTIYGRAANPLFLIGDPKQSIYKFRGADIFAYLQAVKSAGSEVYSMDTNWRSDPGLVKGVNLIFGRHRHASPFYLPEINFQQVRPADKQRDLLEINGDQGAALNFVLFEPQAKRDMAKNQVCGDLSAKISRLIGAGLSGKGVFRNASGSQENLRAGDIAVLVRNHLDGELVRQHLQEKGVRAVIHSRKDVFTSLDARELQIVLEGVVDHTRLSALKAALVTSLLGWDMAALVKLEESEAAWEEVLERFSEYNKLWSRNGLAVMLFRLFGREGVNSRLAGVRNGERRLTNLRHLIELLQGKVHEERLGPVALLNWLKKERHRGRELEERQLRLESDENLVNIVTIHKCKGLEYPLVFCPFLWDSSFLRQQKAGWILWHDEDGKAHIDMGTAKWPLAELGQEKEVMSEELRLLYVALTRARNRCYIYWGKVMSKSRPVTASSALNYLLHAVADGETSLIKRLEDEFKSFAESEISSSIYEIAALAPAEVKVSLLEELTADKGLPAAGEKRLAQAPKFAGAIRSGWRIHSFSSLQQHDSGEHENPDRDAILIAPEKSVVTLPSEKGILDLFSFPRGAQAGSCLHDIFENIDFANFNGQAYLPVIENSLQTFGFDKIWGAPLLKGLENILNTALDEKRPGLCLADIGMDCRLNELEFYYSIPGHAEKILGEIYNDKSPESLENIGKSNNPDSPARSFMKGFVDLIFQWQGRYYIVDYKSNYLGDSFTDYDGNNLQLEMKKAGYDLQYHIYLVALHRYLARRLPGYDYDLHMGGVYYLFIRGMAPDNGAKFGVFADLPDREVVERMNSILLLN